MFVNTRFCVRSIIKLHASSNANALVAPQGQKTEILCWLNNRNMKTIETIFRIINYNDNDNLHHLILTFINMD